MNNLYTLVRENGKLKMVRNEDMSDEDEDDFKTWSSLRISGETVKRTPEKKPKQKYEKFCLFCKKAGFTFNDHFMKKNGKDNGEIVCPRILNSVCTNCGDKGHTKSYCKKSPYSSEEDRNSFEKLSSSFEANSGEYLGNSYDEHRNSFDAPSSLDRTSFEEHRGSFEEHRGSLDGFTNEMNESTSKLDLSNCTDPFGQNNKCCEYCRSLGFPSYVVSTHNEWERLGNTSVLTCPAKHFESLKIPRAESKHEENLKFKPRKLFDKPEFSDFEPTVGKSRHSLSTEVSSSLESNISGISRISTASTSYEY